MVKNKLIKTTLAILGALTLASENSFAMLTANGDLALNLKDRPIESIIVKFNKNSSIKTLSTQDLSEIISQKTNLDVSTDRAIDSNTYVFNINNNNLARLNTKQAADYNQSLENKLTELKKDPRVQYADLNGYVYVQKIPNDSRYPEQWHYFEETGGMNMPEAWDITTGTKDIVIGVIDTGIVKHENLSGKILPGHNFVSSKDDKNKKDDPTDHGGDTSYHGTHVAGTAAAVTNKNNVVSGMSWGSKILPVRVLDDNGSGSFADIIAGIRWAAGLTTTDNKPDQYKNKNKYKYNYKGKYPKKTEDEDNDTNLNPAKVINLSLGGLGKCPALLQSSIDEINKIGGSVVVAAGNSSLPARLYTPANCKGVIVVGATNREGKKAFYSNYGKTVTIAAPGGEKDSKKDDSDEKNEVLSLAAPGEYQFLQGTSMATPHISGLIALMYSINKDLTHEQVVKYLQKGAKGDIMGVGIADAKKTLELVKAGDEEA